MSIKRVEVGFDIGDHPEIGEVDGERVAETAIKAVMAVWLGNGVLKNWDYTVNNGPTSLSSPEDSSPLPD